MRNNENETTPLHLLKTVLAGNNEIERTNNREDNSRMQLGCVLGFSRD